MIFLCVLTCSCGKVKAANAYGRVLNVAAEKAEPEKQTEGRAVVYPLDAETLVLAADLGKTVENETRRRFGKRLALADKLFSEGVLPLWAHRFFYNYALFETAPGIHKSVHDLFQKKESFRVTADGEEIPIAENGYWINAVGEFRMPRSDGGERILTSSGDLVHFAYLRLKRPLRNGETTVVSAGKMQTEFVWSEAESVSRAIKVNQVGWLPDAPCKYAYLGMWLGSLGEMPMEGHLGKPFRVVDESDGKTAFEGKLAARSKEQYHDSGKRLMPLNGETTLEMDFSTLTKPGKYHIEIPGVGRSWSFLIGNDAIGKAFYVNMRGLFHQRSGIAKTEAHTKWTFAKDHPTTFRGGFSPDDRQYGGRENAYFDESGKAVSKLRHFEVVAATRTDEELKDVFGGWWDAGDFDRRSYHFQIVDALLGVYMLSPEKFTDGQLDIPESGNGFPDLVDEAAWGVDVWRRAQNAEGGVGCWIEATSHPENPDPDKDTQRYYLALPTHASSLEYAAYAAKLARAYAVTEGMEGPLAKKFLESARKAWDFAVNDRKRIVQTFEIPKKGKFTYREPEQLPPHLIYKAALALQLASKDPYFRKWTDNPELFEQAFLYMKNNRRPYFLAELAEKDCPVKMASMKFRAYVAAEADKLLESQKELAYRNINWPIGNRFFLFLGWGQAHPFVKGQYLILAWKITGWEKYRTAALLLADWQLGANPMGRSLTTGLGTVCPVRLLSLPGWSRENRWNEPIPGLSPYTFTGMNHYEETVSVCGIRQKPRPDQNFKGCEITLLPDAWTGGKDLTREESFNLLQSKVPVWRRFCNMESKAVDQNEFSVWETIAPAAAGFAALLPDNWTPPPDWKQREPVKDVRDLPGYLFLP